MQPSLLHLLDCESVPPGISGRTLFWSKCDTEGLEVSLPRLVEKSSEKLRAEFLEWVHDLGETRIDGVKSLRELLQIDGSSSVWWNTLIAEKSPHKTPAIYTVLKLRMLERFVQETPCSGLVLHSSHPILNRVLSSWCARTGLSYQWVRTESSKSEMSSRDRFNRLPHLLQAALSFGRRALRRAQAGRVPSRALSPRSDQATVISYFPNIDLNAEKQGKFRSNYWGALQDLLDGSDPLMNWVLFFVRNKTHSYSDAVKFCREMNLRAGQRRFFVLESFISLTTLRHALFIYMKLVWKTFAIRNQVREAFAFKGSKLNFWPVLAWEWRSATYGFSAMEISFWRAMFSSMAARLPRQQWGLYLQENQSWERALTSAWRSAGHGQLIGYQHVFPRYLDTRLFEDSRSYRMPSDSPPLPDVLAVAGASAARMLAEVGYPNDRIRQVEAVRYNYLNGQYGSVQAAMRGVNRTLLVTTGVIHQESLELISTLADATWKPGFDSYSRILIKSHPAMPVKKMIEAVRSRLPMEETSSPLSALWPDVDVAFCANSTSVSLEALWIGKPVIVMGSLDALNLNPLFGVADLKFVSSSEELSSALADPRAASIPSDFFCFTQDSAGWKTLLSNTSNTLRGHYE